MSEGSNQAEIKVPNQLYVVVGEEGPFTAQQLKVLEYWVNGYPLKRIAHILGLSKKTVEKHLFGQKESASTAKKSEKGVYGIIQDMVGERFNKPQLITFLINKEFLSFQKPQGHE